MTTSLYPKPGTQIKLPNFLPTDPRTRKNPFRPFDGGFQIDRSWKEKYDNAPLRASEDHPYTRTLDKLAERWLRWALDLRQELEIDDSAATRRMEAELFFAGLKLTVYSASFQTLPTKRKKASGVDEGAIQFKFASGNSK